MEIYSDGKTSYTMHFQFAVCAMCGQVLVYKERNISTWFLL